MNIRTSFAAICIIMLLLLPCLPAGGSSVPFAVFMSGESGPYQEALAGCQKYLREQGVTASFDVFVVRGKASADAETLDRVKKGEYKVFLTFGASAISFAAETNVSVPIVAGMILQAEVLRNAAGATGVVLEFPLETQFKAMRSFFPSVRNVGVLYNPAENKNLVEAAIRIGRQSGFEIQAQKVSSPKDLPGALESLSRSVEVIWGVPDNLVLNSDTAKHILLFSYRNRIPFIGLSSQWVKAGAVYALDRDYGDIGSQCGELVLKVLRGARPSEIQPVAPRKVLFSVNLKAANHMKVNIPETVLSKANAVFSGE